jgi:hypothetical protein
MDLETKLADAIRLYLAAPDELRYSRSMAC